MQNYAQFYNYHLRDEQGETMRLIRQYISE